MEMWVEGYDLQGAEDRDNGPRNIGRKDFCGKAAVSVNYGLKSQLFNRLLHNSSTARVPFYLPQAGGSLYNRRPKQALSMPKKRQSNTAQILLISVRIDGRE